MNYFTLLGLLLGAFVLSACGVQQGASAPAPTAAMPAMDHGGAGHSDGDNHNADAPYDARFIDSMIMHHQGAIAMANQALTQAEKPEIKQLAQGIVKAQENEITQMQSWRKMWYADLAATQGLDMDMGMMEVSNDTSKPFDLRFIEAMIPHHQGAIEMAKDAQEHAEHPEIRTLAGQIITAQEGEIAQMQAWKQQWFKQ